MTLFDGTADPFDHVSQYKQKMMTLTDIRHVKEACMCKGFRFTLSEATLRWLVSLLNRSISTFTDLVKAFTQHFVSSRKPQLHAGDLYRIIQGANETIEEFNTSFEAVQEKAAATIRLEEDVLARGINRIGNREENQQIPTLAEYGFTTGVRGILKALREMGDGVRWPRPRVEGQSWRKDSKKKCEFHRHIEHTTEDYYILRREVRRMYEQGELSHLLPHGGKKQDKVGSANQSKPTTPPTCTKIINVIAGGSDLSGLIYSATKRHATENKGDRLETSCTISHSDLPAVTFDEGDVHDSQEHHDALIITLSMANYTVRKVCEKDLQKKTIPLVGFSGETTNLLGEIVIPTYAGGINKQVRYLVIDEPSTYNVILGRPWLHLMEAVPSTNHQCVKFPTPWGVEKIWGDQEEARGCYKKALKCTASPPA
ncbi:uncharacterized protein LOC141649314 [Silene latifolia]|uniref:uncharacterized protein LOC141649314 n=1 Tax=Silene latifolia TaxID=37657 RepID=UPI003D77E6EF